MVSDTEAYCVTALANVVLSEDGLELRFHVAPMYKDVFTYVLVHPAIEFDVAAGGELIVLVRDVIEIMSVNDRKTQQLKQYLLISH